MEVGIFEIVRNIKMPAPVRLVSSGRATEQAGGKCEVRYIIRKTRNLHVQLTPLYCQDTGTGMG